MKKIVPFLLLFMMVIITHSRGQPGQPTEDQTGASKIETAQETPKSASHKELVLKVNAMWNSGEYEQAPVYVDQAIAISGETEELLEYKWDIFWKLGDYTRGLPVALKLEQVAMRKSPWNCLKIAEAYIQTEQNEKAIVWIEKAITERAFRRFRTFENEVYDPIRDDIRFTRLIEQTKENIGLGKLAEDFTAALLNGRKIVLSSMKGKVVLVDFWATWCSPCIREMPNLKQLYADFRDRDFEIIGISLDENPANLKNYVQENNLNWKICYSGKGWSDQIAKTYQVNALPSTWLLDREGILRHYNLRGEELRVAVMQLLEE